MVFVATQNFVVALYKYLSVEMNRLFRFFISNLVSIIIFSPYFPQGKALVYFIYINIENLFVECIEIEY